MLPSNYTLYALVTGHSYKQSILTGRYWEISYYSNSTTELTLFIAHTKRSITTDTDKYGMQQKIYVTQQ